MNRPEPELSADREIIPAKKLSANVIQTLAAQGDDFVSKPVDALRLGYGGIDGDFHAGLTRASGSREPWYERGTQMRNERQISIVSREELAVIAANMGVSAFDAGWIGANLVLEGVEDMSFLPARTLMFFEGGVTLRVDGYNGPCRSAGGQIARHLGSMRTGGEPATSRFPGPEFDWTRTDMAISFVNAARMKRGLVAWVEREGVIRPGESVRIRVWEQWIY